MNRMLALIRYRARQFWHELRPPRLTGADWRLIDATLAPAEAKLFRRLSASDQAHSLQVLLSLKGKDVSDQALLAAGLLHDIGKTRGPLYLWDRVLIVLAGRFLPGKMARWGTGAPRGWRRPFVVKASHPSWGAAMAAAAGSDPVAVALIQFHQADPGTDPAPATNAQLQQLQWADNHQ